MVQLIGTHAVHATRNYISKHLTNKCRNDRGRHCHRLTSIKWQYQNGSKVKRM